MWAEDDLPDFAYDPPRLECGQSFDVTHRSWSYPDVVRPIGFMRDKPRVRIKAWTCPILLNHSS